MEVTNSLHELEVENNIIKLTGYISDPCNTLDMKVIYISNAKRHSSISSHCNFGVGFSVSSPNFSCVTIFSLQALQYLCILVKIQVYLL